MTAGIPQARDVRLRMAQRTATIREKIRKSCGPEYGGRGEAMKGCIGAWTFRGGGMEDDHIQLVKRHAGTYHIWHWLNGGLLDAPTRAWWLLSNIHEHWLL